MTDSPGALIRDWRRRRNVSQLDLSHRAGVSARHVSFIETGRSRPTSAMILRLCDQLSVQLREQNRLLLAAGYAPAHPEHGLAEPPMAQISAAIDAVLAGQMPYPGPGHRPRLGPGGGQRRGLRTARGRGSRTARAAGQRDPVDDVP